MSRTSGGTVSFQQWFSKSSAMVLSLERVSGPANREPSEEANGVKARSQAAAMRCNRRASSAPEVVRRGAAPSLSFSLTHVRERSAVWRYVFIGTSVKVPRAFARHAASRRSTVASSTPGPSRRVRTEELSSPVIRAAFAVLHPDRRGLLAKAALRSKGGREPRATRTSCARNTRARAPHLLRHYDVS